MSECQKQPTVKPIVTEEQILVVPCADFFSHEPAWHGLKRVAFDEYLQLINQKKQFLPRSLMEQDVCYKQIIPYLVFEAEGKYFLMQRKKNSSEQRLNSKYSLGIGGHIREEDLREGSIFQWAQREFYEEVNFSGTVTFEPLGIINDDSNPVGQVHVGFVFLVHGDSANISVKSELQQGMLSSLEECDAVYDNMEQWSQMVFDLLKSL
jgi:predicted NUDIX family phosphoesterase